MCLRLQLSIPLSQRSDVALVGTSTRLFDDYCFGQAAPQRTTLGIRESVLSYY